MADWKLLSFYTASSGSPNCLNTKDDLSPSEDFQQDSSKTLSASQSHSQEVFCTGNNITSCISYLNQELELLGLPSVICNNNGQPNSASLLNRAYDLFRCYQRMYSTKDELENRIQKISSEREHHKSSVMRSTRQNETLEKSLAQETEKLRQLSSRHKVTNSKLKLEKDEVKCLQSVIHHKELQYKHELKKKEREINKLKDRLHQMLMDKNPDRKVGMDLMNTVHNSDGKRRGQWKPGLGKQEEEMYQMLVRNYEERHGELVLENTELRDCLLAMQRELCALLKQTSNLSAVQSPPKPVADLHDLSSSSSGEQQDDSDEETGVQGYLTVAELNEGYYQMPYDMVRHEIERAFKQTCERIGLSVKRTWKKKPDSPACSKKAGSNSKIEVAFDLQQLQAQLRKYKDIIQQQEQLIQHSFQTHSDSFLHESQLLHEKDILAREKKLFHEEKAHFDEERKLFAEAAVKLSKERKAVQEEKMKFLKDHFLNITPFKDKQSIVLKGTEGTSRLLPATPNFSPVPGSYQAKTPNTAELYRALALLDFPREGQDSSTPLSPPRGPVATLDMAVGRTEPMTSSIHLNIFSSPAPVNSNHSVQSDNQ